MNKLIENVKGIARVSLEENKDWSVSLSEWEHRNPKLCEDVTPEDRSEFYRYVKGRRYGLEVVELKGA